MSRLTVTKKKGKFGYKDESGEIVVPLKYDFADGFRYGTACVRVGFGGDRRYGLIDETGKEVVPPQYEEMEDLQEGLRQVQKAGKWGYIDASGKVIIDLAFDQATEFIGGLANVKIGTQWGMIDKSGAYKKRLTEMTDGDATHLLVERIRAQPLTLSAKLSRPFHKYGHVFRYHAAVA